MSAFQISKLNVLTHYAPLDSKWTRQATHVTLHLTALIFPELLWQFKLVTQVQISLYSVRCISTNTLQTWFLVSRIDLASGEKMSLHHGASWPTNGDNLEFVSTQSS